MDIEIHPSSDETLLEGETSTAGPSERQDDHPSTAGESDQGQHVNVVDTVLSLQQNMASVTNTLHNLDKAIKTLTGKRTAQLDEVDKLPNKVSRPDISSDLNSLLDGAAGGSIMDDKELEDESSDEDSFLASIETAIGPNNKLGPELENSKLAGIMNKCFSSPISYEAITAKQDLYLTPQQLWVSHRALMQWWSMGTLWQVHEEKRQ